MSFCLLGPDILLKSSFRRRKGSGLIQEKLLIEGLIWHPNNYLTI